MVYHLQSFYGIRARVTGTLSNCPSQHGFVAQGMFQKVGIQLNTEQYKSIPYLKINSIKLYRKKRDNICSLLGSPWAATIDSEEPYLVQYGYFSNQEELDNCVSSIIESPSWKNVRVFYDAIKTPTPTLSFTKQFIL